MGLRLKKFRLLPTERPLINPDRGNGRCVAAGDFQIVLAIWQTLRELYGGFGWN